MPKHRSEPLLSIQGVVNETSGDEPDPAIPRKYRQEVHEGRDLSSGEGHTALAMAQRDPNRFDVV